MPHFPADAATHLKRWITTASRAAAINTLARRLARNACNADAILNAIHHQLSNSLTEGLNAGIRLIQRRAHGYANLNNLNEMIYLCHSRVPTPSPQKPSLVLVFEKCRTRWVACAVWRGCRRC
jgi:transposase